MGQMQVPEVEEHILCRSSAVLEGPVLGLLVAQFSLLCERQKELCHPLVHPFIPHNSWGLAQEKPGALSGSPVKLAGSRVLEP